MCFWRTLTLLFPIFQAACVQQQGRIGGNPQLHGLLPLPALHYYEGRGEPSRHPQRCPQAVVPAGLLLVPHEVKVHPYDDGLVLRGCYVNVP